MDHQIRPLQAIRQLAQKSHRPIVMLGVSGVESTLLPMAPEIRRRIINIVYLVQLQQVLVDRTEP